MKNYYLYLKNFFMTVRKKPSDITGDDVIIYLRTYQKERKVEAQSVDKIRVALNSFYKWACTHKYINENPMILVPKIKVETKIQDFLSLKEIEKVRSVCKTAREKALIEFLISSACRVSEACHARKDDIFFNDGEKEIRIRKTKNRKEFDAFIDAKADIALEEYFKTRNDDCPYLFVTERGEPRPLSKDVAERIVKDIKKRAGITKHLTPHTLRRTTATHCLRKGMSLENVQKMLNHASPSTTLIYAQISHSEVKREHIKYAI